MIEFQNVSKGYKDKPVLFNINMKIETGEFVVLIGSSGCNGFPVAGEILLPSPK